MCSIKRSIKFLYQNFIHCAAVVLKRVALHTITSCLSTIGVLNFI